MWTPPDEEPPSERFHRAVRHDDVQEVRTLLAEVGAHLADEPDWSHNGKTPLLTATLRGCTEIVRILIDTGCDINARNALGETALHLAVHPERLRPAIVAALLEAESVDCGAQEKLFGYTPLHILSRTCVTYGTPSAEILGLLEQLAAGGKVNATSYRTESPLHRAATGQVDSPEVLQVLLTAGADVDAQNDRGETVLMCLTDRGRWRGAQVILEAGAQVDLRDQYGQTALHYAARRNLPEMTALLLSFECDMNAADLNEDTALHVAASKGHAGVASLLLAHPNVDVDLHNRRGKTPLHEAVESGFAETVDLLLQARCGVAEEAENCKVALEAAQDAYIRRRRPEISAMISQAMRRKGFSREIETIL